MPSIDKAPQRSTDTNRHSKVLDVAQELSKSLPRTADALPAQEVERRDWACWNEQNKDAIATYNERIKSDGLPLARYRTFARGR